VTSLLAPSLLSGTSGRVSRSEAAENVLPSMLLYGDLGPDIVDQIEIWGMSCGKEVVTSGAGLILTILQY
jgi:hypothetical protein